MIDRVSFGVYVDVTFYVSFDCYVDVCVDDVHVCMHCFLPLGLHAASHTSPGVNRSPSSVLPSGLCFPQFPAVEVCAFILLFVVCTVYMLCSSWRARAQWPARAVFVIR